MQDDAMSETELRVVCRECGSEVSPYVTECPYCGSRVRKRAPKLEHHDDHFEAKPSAGARLRSRLPKLRINRLFRAGEIAGTGLLSPAVVLAVSALVLLSGVAAGLSLYQVGAVSGPIEGQWWRYLTAPFAYDSVGYLFAVGLAIAIFGSGIEQRLGAFPTLVLMLGCGGLGVLAGYGASVALETSGSLIAGGNSIALGSILAWWALRRGESRAGVTDPPDLIGVGVAVIVVLLLPLVESSADVFAGIAGGLVGGILGLIAARARRD